MPVASNLNNLAGLNAVVAAKGGALTYLNEINALNSIDLIETGAGGYLNGLSALNSIDVLLGGVGGYENELAALNSVVVLEGGVGGWLNTIDAINEWVDNAEGGFVFFLDDQFTDGPVAAPISSPRVSLPGPGKLVINADVGNGIEILATDKLDFDGDNVSADNTEVVWTDDDDAGFTFTVSVVCRFKADVKGNMSMGVASAANPTSSQFIGLADLSEVRIGAFSPKPLAPIQVTEETYYLVQRTTGVVILWVNPSFELEVIWLSRVSMGSPGWPGAQVRNPNSLTINDMAVFTALGSSWATQTSPLDVYVASSFSDPEIFTMPHADSLINFVGLVSGESVDVEFRRQDNNNKWIGRFDAPSLTMKIIEVTATVEVERASEAIQINSGFPYALQCRGAEIALDNRDGRKKVSYLSATAFQTATDARIVGATATQTHLEVMRLNLDGTQRATDLGL